MDEPVWNVTVFTKNRERLLKADVAKQVFGLVVEQAKALNLMSDEDFTVDGTLLEACASLKSFKKVEAGAEPPVVRRNSGQPPVRSHVKSRNV
jgi:transposase